MGIPTGFSFIKDEDIPTMVKYALAEANPSTLSGRLRQGALHRRHTQD